MSNDIDAFLTGGGGRSAKFEAVGDIVSGVICAQPELRQQTDFDTDAPLTWDDGSPRMQLVVRLQTDQADSAEDDGVRNLYVRGGFKRATLQKAVADAVRAAGVKGLAVGGTLTVKLTGFDEPHKKGAKPPKLYAAKYEPPSAKGVDDFLGTPAAQPAAAAAPAGKGGWDDSEVPF